MKITACSIVKNEEHNISRSIESYADAVDEIIIVDTGSTDNTVEACKILGADVLTYEWNNNFSAAKNYALQNAKGDWIVFLDADEWFSPKLKKDEIRNILVNLDKATNGLITTMCEFDDIQNKVLAREITMRIFKNSPQIRYRGSIHEKLMNGEREMLHQKCLEIEIYHSGYANGLGKTKSKRNLKILNNILNKDEKTTTLNYYLFRENFILENVDDAIKFYNIFMKQKDAEQIIKSHDSIVCVYEYMYRLMVKFPDKFCKVDINNLLTTAFNKYPNLPIHSYLIGCEKFKEKDFINSYEWISKSIELNSEFVDPYTNTFTYYISEAYCKLGHICIQTGSFEKAFDWYIKAVKGANINELLEILPNLYKIIEAQPEEDIILFLNSVLDISVKETIQCILMTLKKTRLHKVFIYYALKYNQEFDGQDDTTYLAMILTGQAELAVETAILANQHAKVTGNQMKGGADNTIHEGWQMDYAVIAILFSKNKEMYKKYRESFSIVQREIVEAYLEERKCEHLCEELEKELKKIKNDVYYIFNQQEMDCLQQIVM